MKAPKQQGASPPLPAPDRTMWQYGKQIDHYTAEQMKAYACHYAEMCNELEMTAKTPAERQAALKARRLRDGLVQWKRWVHPDDAPALAQYADSLASARAAQESAPKPHNTRVCT